MRPNKETLENIRKAAKELEKVERAEGPHMHATICLRPEVANELLAEIDALTAELKASEWVRRDNSLRTYDGLTEENQRLREALKEIIDLQPLNEFERKRIAREALGISGQCAQAGSRPHMSSQGVHAGCNYLAAIDSGFCNKCNRFFTSSATSRGDDNGP